MKHRKQYNRLVKIEWMKQIFSIIFGLPAMAFLLVMYGISMALATFIENDFGTTVAKEFIYSAWWFETMMVLLIINLVINLFKYKVAQRKKLSIFLFHLAFLFMILGAAATRYIGFEGIVHFREGESQNFMLSEQTYLTVYDEDKPNSVFQQKAVFSPFSFESIDIELDSNIKIQFTEFIPNAKAVLNKVEIGNIFIELVFMENGNFSTYPLEENGLNIYKNTTFLIGKPGDLSDILFYQNNEHLFMYASDTIFVTNMEGSTLDKSFSTDSVLVEKNMLYSTKGISFVVKDFYLNAEKQYIAGDYKITGESVNVLKGIISNGIHKMPFTLIGNSISLPKEKKMKLDDKTLVLAYGLKKLDLPFFIELTDFQLDRYPGSESPESYASEVRIIDSERNTNFSYRIFMNNVLDYRGYRFFQSSYDSDEKGSILSVNYDKIGTYLTYFSYLLMSFGMLWSLFNPSSRFLFLMRNVSKLHKKRITGLLIVFMFIAKGLQAQEYKPIEKEHAEYFGQLYIQTADGRVKTISSLSSEILRKISQKTSWKGLSPEQVFLGISFQPEYWINEPIIRIADKELANSLGISGKYISFNALVNLEKQTYALRERVNKAYEKSPAYRNTSDKELLKLDEKVNIFYMMYTGQFLNVFPYPSDNMKPWALAGNSEVLFSDSAYSNYAQNVFKNYASKIDNAMQNDNWQYHNTIVDSIMNYQKTFASNLLPSPFKASLESIYERWQIFERIFPWYALIGSVLIILLFINVLSPGLSFQWFITILKTIIFVLFAIHTIALGARWYISGHAPWSDGFEAMVYLAWSLMLAGTFYSRKSAISLAGASLLSSVVLMVAHLNWMDPTITNLVPVLNSYWLSIHVSIITASYGFLGLGSLLGFLALILLIIKNQKNISKILPTLKELSMVNEMNLTIGLYLLTIGTFLGGVWANESWGRYWGWDPKETWALISVVVYVFVVHMRLIPGLRGYFAFNFMAMISYASIMMTFFGVNFYLSGLHSYAKGDPVPVPSFVYYLLFILALVSIAAYYKEKKNTVDKDESLDV